MLVCSHCGTETRVAGQPCARCGQRGTVDARFYEGEVTPLGDAPQAHAAATQASRSDSLPESERAWSPWLAAVLSVLFGPAAAVIVATRNVARFQPTAVSPWWLASAVIAQVVAAVVAGVLSKETLGAGTTAPFAAVNVVFAALLVRLQAPVVAEQRRQQPGRHEPGSDAFGAFLVGVVVSLLLLYLSYALADRFSGQTISTKWREAREAAKAAEPLAPMMGMPPM